MKTEICFTKAIVIANITFLGIASFLNTFTVKGVKYDPHQQNNDLERSGVLSPLKFCTESLKVASNQMSHNMIGFDHQNSRNSNFNFVSKTKSAELENGAQQTKETDQRRCFGF